MLELAVRMVIDFGLSRRKALMIITLLTAIIGTPSAISLDFFNNQDWVWGLGLLLSGLFFTISVIKIGVPDFIDHWLMPASGRRFYKIIFRILFYVIIPLEFTVMFGWWLWQSSQWNPGTWWNPLTIFGIGTCLVQWGLVIGLGIYFGPRWADKLRNVE
jgi:NSS family neurotransmitter:Na+ symporter